MIKAAFIYFGLAAFVAVWWSFAFTEAPRPFLTAALSQKETIASPSPSRSQVVQALQGDFPLMAQLILEWDIEAEIQQKNRLSSEKVLRAQHLAKKIALRKKSLGLKILPQTYASASILLTLAQPEDLVALPRGFREQTDLYPKKATDLIPLDVDHYTTERLFLTHPALAIVSSHYSHPSTLQALTNQGIAIQAFPTPESVEEILQQIGQIGELIGRSHEAELLQLFVEAAFSRLDQIPIKSSKTLFLAYYDHFYVPRKGSLISSFAIRAGLSLQKMPPLMKEALLQADPERLVISLSPQIDLLPLLQKDHAYAALRAVREGHVHFVNDEIMQTPTHFAVLAYWDFIEALRQ